MTRYFIDLAYKGTHFSGLQKQDNARSVQGELNKALQTILKQSIDTVTSSRTDAGVHCEHNFLHFDSDIIFSTEKLSYQLNAVLDQDISVHQIRKVIANAHSRFSAQSRIYSYKIHQHKNPLIREFSYFYPFHLDFELMQEASRVFLATIDFESFSKKHTEVQNFDCRLSQCKWIKHNAYESEFIVEGNRFLRGMVRGLVGTSLQIGRAKITIDDLHNIIASKDCNRANFSAEARGLTLLDVKYPEEVFLC